MKRRHYIVIAAVLSVLTAGIVIRGCARTPGPQQIARYVPVSGHVTDSDGKAAAGVRVLFSLPDTNKVLAHVTKDDGSFEGKSIAGAVHVRVTDLRQVQPPVRPSATVLFEGDVLVPEHGGVVDIKTQKAIPLQ